MKYILTLFLLLSTTAFAKEGVLYDAVITRVIDGDTVAIEAKWLPDPLRKELHIRIFGIDTPEKASRAKCVLEAQRGKDASVYTKALVAKSQKQQVLLIDWDKYGGRVLGDIILDGKSLRESLIKNNMARAYFGKAKQSWCEK